MTDKKVRQGTAAWFEMVGKLMRDAATQAGLSPDLNVSLVEHYTDGTTLADGLVQGIRLDIRKGAFSFSVGARPDEQADIKVALTAAAARTLNTLYSADPVYRATRDAFLESGEMRVEGDAARFGAWFDTVHDPIVDRTS
ncbi:hypothetical protein BH10PSE12_BH10PSE12_32920 [soil metagenome]